VLKDNCFFVESSNPLTLQRLLKEKTIRDARITENKLVQDEIDPNSGFYVRENFEESAIKLDDYDSKENSEILNTKVYSFEIDSSQVEKAKENCIRIDYPMTEYYDYLNDPINPQLDIDLNAQTSTSIRSYQEKCLSKMFGSGRARSGVIVLPCGAGKTLVGITAVSTVKKNTLIMCPNNVSVVQWYKQFKLWANVNDQCLVRWTATEKDPIPKEGAVIIFTTYTMISKKGKRAEESEKFMREIEKREWGLLVMDECHMMPADNFREVVTKAKAHCKLGLTATLLREDDKAEDLYYLIGPKLYEANWLDLKNQGYLANVQCVEVWCDMTPEFFKGYLESPPKKQTYFFELNPNKFRACEFLIRYHEARGDKIIVQ
jgi:DNA excision repair protein ERCC-3